MMIAFSGRKQDNLQPSPKIHFRPLSRWFPRCMTESTVSMSYSTSETRTRNAAASSLDSTITDGFVVVVKGANNASVPQPSII